MKSSYDNPSNKLNILILTAMAMNVNLAIIQAEHINVQT